MSDRYQRPEMIVTFTTEKGQAGSVRFDLGGLATIDRADVEYVMKKAEQELRRLDASRQFNGQERRR